MGHAGRRLWCLLIVFPLTLLALPVQVDTLPARVATPYTLFRDHWPSRSGPAGVAIAPATAPDIAFIDIGLPGVDSPEVGRRIRAAGGEG